MEALVITLREGIEAALVLGIILAYLRKTGRMSLNRHVYTGVALALVASVTVAYAFQLIGFDPENEYLEGAMLGVAGFFVAGMVFWMWRTAKGMKRGVENKLQDITADSGSKAAAGGGVGLLLFTFFMVFREGIETVIFLWATALGEEASLLDFMGGVLGLGLAALFAVLFIRGSIKINLSRFFNVTGAVLLVLAAKLLAGSAHEFSEVGVIPITKEIMAVLGYFVRDTSSTVIVMALVAVPIFMLLWESLRQGTKPGPLGGESNVDRRKRLAAVKLERTWQMGLAVATLLIVMALGATAFASDKFTDPVPEPVQSTGDSIRIPLDSLEEGALHKYSYAPKGVDVRFLAARLHDGSIVTAIDACDICGAAGYGYDGEVAICKNCNAPIAMNTFGYGGGCNPRVLGAKVQGSDLVIATSSLEQMEKVFTKK